MDERFTVCLSCHGADGQSRVPETPSLGGQPSFFWSAQLFLFRDGRRNNLAMIAAAKGLTNDDLVAFADRIAKLAAAASSRGRLPIRRVSIVAGADAASSLRCLSQPRTSPAGSRCRGSPTSAKTIRSRRMREYKSGARLGYGGAMAQELADLTDQDLIDLAHFLSHQRLAALRARGEPPPCRAFR